MNLKYYLNLLLLSIPFVVSSECNDIDSKLLKSVTKCTTDENGKITGLSIRNTSLNKEQVNQLLSYNLKELSYTIEVEVSSNYRVPIHKGYSEIPPAINKLKNLEYLYIYFDSYIHPCASDCAFAGVIPMGKNVLKDLTNLKYLHLGGIELSQDNIDEISTLENLETLEFYQSYLKESLNYKPLGDLKKLNKLYAEQVMDGYVSNQDTSSTTYTPILPENLVKSNKGLKELQMIIGVVKISKDDLPNLEKLKIRWRGGEYDTCFVEGFDKLTDLAFLYRGRGMGVEYSNSYVNADISKLQNLKSLYFQDMFMTEELMEKIISLKNLKELTFSSVVLYDGFIEKLKSLKNITALHFVDNYSPELGDAIKTLTNLKKLSIDSNFNAMDGVLPEFIYSLTNLEYLSLYHNQISSVDDDKLGKLVNLKHLDLSDNYLKTIPKSIENFKKLEYLNLSGNEIYDDSPYYLSSFENLKYL